MAGLDRAAIRRRAEQRGLVRPDAVLTNSALDAMIFEPGFSTAEQVTDVSGRGVGMDVVKAQTAAAGGRVDVSTQRDGAVTLHQVRLGRRLGRRRSPRGSRRIDGGAVFWGGGQRRSPLFLIGSS